jgi:hypothetical protein
MMTYTDHSEEDAKLIKIVKEYQRNN